MSVEQPETKPKKAAAKKTAAKEVKAAAPAKTTTTKAPAAKAVAKNGAASTASLKTVKARTSKDPVPVIAPTPSSQEAKPRPSHEEIAMRAYFLFEERGYRHGFHEQDWFRAEHEL